jgi:hypothetical protein
MTLTNACTPALKGSARGGGRGCAWGRIPVFAIVALLLTGCESLKVLTFQEDARSGREALQKSDPKKYPKQSTRMFLLSPRHPSKFGLPCGDLGVGTTGPSKNELCTDLAAALRREGLIDTPPGADTRTAFVISGAVLLPAAAYAGHEALSFLGNQLASLAEELEENGQKKYHVSILTHRQAFSPNLYLMVVRGDWANAPVASIRTPGEILPPNPGLVLLVKVEPLEKSDFAADVERLPTIGGAVRLRTLFLRVENAMAITGKGKPISISLAFVGKAVRNTRGVRTFGAFAQETMEFQEVAFGSSLDDQDGSGPSGLIPLPPDDASVLELTVAITESGSAIPDAKRARAELEALEEALGEEINDLAD